jgi:hypothetical protein
VQTIVCVGGVNFTRALFGSLLSLLTPGGSLILANGKCVVLSSSFFVLRQRRAVVACCVDEVVMLDCVQCAHRLGTASAADAALNLKLSGFTNIKQDGAKVWTLSSSMCAELTKAVDGVKPLV